MSVKGRRNHLNSHGVWQNLAPNITKFQRQWHVLHDSCMASSLPLFVSVSFRPSRRVASRHRGVVQTLRGVWRGVKRGTAARRETQDNTIPADSVYSWSFDPGLSCFPPPSLSLSLPSHSPFVLFSFFLSRSLHLSICIYERLYIRRASARTHAYTYVHPCKYSGVRANM